MPDVCAAKKNTYASLFKQVIEQGEFHGSLRTLYYTNDHVFFAETDKHKTAAFGGQLSYMTGGLSGLSAKISVLGQVNYINSGGFNNRDLQDNIAVFGEGYLQFKKYGFCVRVGNQRIEAPFSKTYDYRIVPQLYQGLTLKYRNKGLLLFSAHIFGYKSRTNTAYDQLTNYNTQFGGPIPNSQKTAGFNALGAEELRRVFNTDVTGKLWLLNYKDYANLFYIEGGVLKRTEMLSPYFDIQYLHETNDGRALLSEHGLGDIDSNVFGIRFGVKGKAWTASLNYDHIKENDDAYLNGSLVTPYAYRESSGPLFAHPFLSSPQSLGAGDAYSAKIDFISIDNVLLGAQYSYMDLKSSANSQSINQSAFAVLAEYKLSGRFQGVSISNAFSRQHRGHVRGEGDYWENRFSLRFDF